MIFRATLHELYLDEYILISGVSSVSDPNDSQNWQLMLAIKSNILRRMDSAPPGVRICCVKFVQQVVLVQAPGMVDPRVRPLLFWMESNHAHTPQRPDHSDVSLALVPRTAPTLPFPLPPAAEFAAASLLLASSASARLCTSSRLLSSSCSRLCASSAFRASSCSASAASWLAPCQPGCRMRRWLCSVCERMRVQVLRRVEAVVTVLDTVWLAKTTVLG